MGIVDPPWMLALRELHNHTGGVLRVAVVTEADFDALFVRVTAGDPQAVTIFTALRFGMDHVTARPPLPAMPCMACGRFAADRPRSFGVVLPEVPEPALAVALAVCIDCAPERAAVHAALMPFLQTLWPDIRALGPVMAVAGHA